MSTIIEMIMHSQARVEKEQRVKMARLEADRREAELVQKMTDE
jgi:hypothetical protein